MDDQTTTAKRRLFQATTLLLLILSAVAIALFFLAIQWTRVTENLDDQRNTITVNGKGEVVSVPDLAEISFTVQESGKSAGEAQEKATAKTNKITAFLTESGIEKTDIKTTSYQINPQYAYYYEYNGVRCYKEYCPPPYIYKNEITGYEVTQTALITIRSVDKAGEIFAGVGKLNPTYINGLTLKVEKEDALKEEARSIAVGNARAQAEQLARDLGVRLGKVVNFSETGNYPIPLYYGLEKGGYGGDALIAETRAVPAPDVPVGENTIISQVTITYEIR